MSNFIQSNQRSKNMQDNDNKSSSFHGALSRFAYAPASPSFSPALRHAPVKVAQSQIWAQSQSSGEPDRVDKIHGACAPPLPKPPRKRKPERLGRSSHSLRPKKPKIEYAAPEVYAHLNTVPDHVAEDLDGTPKRITVDSSALPPF